MVMQLRDSNCAIVRATPAPPERRGRRGLL
jgi:hypothetical protein